MYKKTQKMTAKTRGPKIPCYPRYPCATTQLRNANNLFSNYQ